MLGIGMAASLILASMPGHATRLDRGAIKANELAALVDDPSAPLTARSMAIAEFSMLGTVYPATRVAFFALCDTLEFRRGPIATGEPEHKEYSLLCIQCKHRAEALKSIPAGIWLLRRCWPFYWRH